MAATQFVATFCSYDKKADVFHDDMFCSLTEHPLAQSTLPLMQTESFQCLRGSVLSLSKMVCGCGAPVACHTVSRLRVHTSSRLLAGVSPQCFTFVGTPHFRIPMAGVASSQTVCSTNCWMGNGREPALTEGRMLLTLVMRLNSQEA